MFVEVTNARTDEVFMLNMNLVNTYQLLAEGRTWVVSGTHGFYVKGHIQKKAGGGYGIKTLF